MLIMLIQHSLSIISCVAKGLNDGNHKGNDDKENDRFVFISLYHFITQGVGRDSCEVALGIQE